MQSYRRNRDGARETGTLETLRGLAAWAIGITGLIYLCMVAALGLFAR